MTISFREVKLSDAEIILRWRTCPRVTKFMNTDIENNVENQKSWLKNCYTKNNYYHWIIESDNKPIGLVYIKNYDPSKKNLGWGFYVGEEDHVGIGGFIPPYLYNFCFKSLGVNHIHSEAFSDNSNVLKLNSIHGYIFTPENNRVLNKNGKDILLISMKLNKEDFIKSKFSRAKANFPMVHWVGKPNNLKKHN